MSVILDALKKAQNERKRVTGPVAGKFSEPSRRPRRVIYAAVGGAILVAVAIYVAPSLYRQKPNITTAPEKSVQVVPPAKEPLNRPAAENQHTVIPALADTGGAKETARTKTRKGRISPEPGMRVAANDQDTRRAASRSQGDHPVPSVTGRAGRGADPVTDEKDGQVEVVRADGAGIAGMFNKALTETERGNTGEAKRLYLAVLAERPNHIESINNLGVMAMKEGNDREALYYFKRALEADKEYGKACNNIGLLLLKRGDKQQAALYFRKSIEIGKSGVEPYVNLAAVLRSEKKPAEASQLLETLLKRGETDPAVHLSYAILKDEMGEPADAIVHYRYYLRETSGGAGIKPVMERLKTLESTNPRRDR